MIKYVDDYGNFSDGQPNQTIKIALCEGGKVPFKKHFFDAGYDCFLNTKEPVTIHPGKQAKLPLGFKAELPLAAYAQLDVRSSYGSIGLICGPRTIDSPYRGEWHVVLLNTSDEPITLNPGDRPCQFIIQPYTPYVSLVEVSEEALSQTERGEGGFGSTGRR